MNFLIRSKTRLRLDLIWPNGRMIIIGMVLASLINRDAKISQMHSHVKFMMILKKSNFPVQIYKVDLKLSSVMTTYRGVNEEMRTKNSYRDVNFRKLKIINQNLHQSVWIKH